jgi:D-alanyl-D-alanine carboxypeptidase
MKSRLLLVFPLLTLLAYNGCAAIPVQNTSAATAPATTIPAQAKDADTDALNAALYASEAGSGLDDEALKAALAGASGAFDFKTAVATVLREDPSFRTLVDKKTPIPNAANYVPPSLVLLPRTGAAYEVSRNGLLLRRSAEKALEEMALAARKDGVTLVVSSTYRSYRYQVMVYNREVARYGRETADRESARPGCSQHQTGFAIDFGSITNEFAHTRAGRWLAKNAGRFGWSLSFPDGYEGVTGYRWESWHYRYVGKTLARFINTWFNGIQQYALEFLSNHEGG